MTVSYSPSQVGWDNGVAWIPGSFGFSSIGPTTGGIQFTIPAPNELLFRSLVFTMTPVFVLGAGGTTTIGLVNDINEGVFDDTTPNLASTQNTIQIYSAVHTYVVGTPVSFNLDLGVNSLQTGNFVGGMESANQVLGHSSFQGNVALVFSDTASTVIADTITLVGDETPFLTGLPTTKHRLSRADWCPRCGQPIFREELSPDGFTKSLVCDDCWDRGETRYPRFVPPKEING